MIILVLLSFLICQCFILNVYRWIYGIVYGLGPFDLDLIKVPRWWCHSDCNTTWEINSRHHRFCPLGNWVLPEGTAKKTQMNHQKFSQCAHLPYKDLQTRLHSYTHWNENDTATIRIFRCPRGHRGDFFFPQAITPPPTPENSPQLSVLSLIFPLPLHNFSASSLCLSVSFTPISPLCPLM